MTFPILPSNSPSGTYTIDNSLRFNQVDSPRLDKTFASAGTSNKVGTFSLWYKRTTIGNVDFLFHAYPNRAGHSNDRTFFLIGSNNDLRMEKIYTGSTQDVLATNQVFRDVGAWYHIVVVFDTTQATASNRVKFYVNGNQITSLSSTNYPDLNQDMDLFKNILHTIGAGYSAGSYNHPLDGYLAEYHAIDGQALSPTDFGEFDEDSGIWKPIEYTGSYGTNGFKLDFSDSGSLGADSSPNGNNFTPTNLASTDQTTDTPTNNFATWNPLDLDKAVTPTLSEGNTKLSQPPSGTSSNSNFGVPSGKWYFECKMTTLNNPWLGIVPQNLHPASSNLFTASNTIGIYAGNPTLYKNGSSQGSLGGGLASGDIVMIAFDIDNGNFYVGKNGLWNDGLGGGFDQADFSNATAHTFTVKTGDNYVVGTVNGSGASSYVLDINFGNPSFSISSGNSDGNGYGNFEYAPPTGFLALCTQNLATVLSPTIDDGSQYFNSILYTGTGVNPTSRTGVGFQPDWIWAKERSSTSSHRLIDSSRGNDKVLESNATDAEVTRGDIQSFDSDGFTTDDGGAINESGQTYIAWNWLAGGGSVSNSDGSISSQVNVNQTAGFSIVTYTGNGTAGATVGHSLGISPKMIIVKSRTSADPWAVYHHQNTSAPETDVLFLNATDATTDNNTYWNDTSPTSSVYSVGTSGRVNRNTTNYVAYCFAPITGYSAIGKYTGSGSSDGTFVYTGFRPAFVMAKASSVAGYSWAMSDTKRNPYNQANNTLYANASDAEYTTLDKFDLLSNGFKLKSVYGNTTGDTYIYMAFAENPFVSSSGVPVVAR